MDADWGNGHYSALSVLSFTGRGAGKTLLLCHSESITRESNRSGTANKTENCPRSDY